MPAPLMEVVGYTAAGLTTLSFIPQAVHSWSTRDLSGISLSMYALFTLGVGLWMLYPIFNKTPLLSAHFSPLHPRQPAWLRDRPSESVM